MTTLIKEKRCGKIKGRASADGRPQRKYIKKEDSASPKVSMEAFLASLIIDAAENWDVAISYLWADIPKDRTVLVKYRG